MSYKFENYDLIIILNKELYRDVLTAARRVRKDFDSNKISNLHPEIDRTRVYHSPAVETVVTDFWLKEATIPEPSYRKVTLFFLILNATFVTAQLNLTNYFLHNSLV